jgi:hypothetical protein
MAVLRLCGGNAPAKLVLLASLAASCADQIVRVQGHAVNREDPNTVQAQAKTLYPADLGGSGSGPDPGSRRLLLVRVHADEAYRRQTIEWKEHIVHQVESANRVLAGFGVELRIARIEPWAAESTGSELDQVLTDLEALDPVTDVDFVIGMVTPLPMVTTAIHMMGIQRMLGRHMVLRGADDTEEYQALAKGLKDLSREEI